MNIFAVYNPAAGNSTRKRFFVKELEKRGIEVIKTVGPNSIDWQISRVLCEKNPVVVVIGGDGTLRETIAATVKYGIEAKFFVYPSGTTNVIAEYLNISNKTIPDFFSLSEVTFDLFVAGDKPFIMALSVGCDAATLMKVPFKTKRKLGRVGIFLWGVVTCFKYVPYTFRVVVEEKVVKCNYLALGNIPYYGGNFTFFPYADPTDGRLDMIAANCSKLKLLLFSIFRILKIPAKITGILEEKVAEITVDRFRVPVQLDGDYIYMPRAFKIKRAGTVTFLR